MIGERKGIRCGCPFSLLTLLPLLYMDINYIVLLDCSVGEVIKIRLSAEEKIESEKYDDFSEFLETLEDKYGFNLNCCSWMSCEVLSERSY